MGLSIQCPIRTYLDLLLRDQKQNWVTHVLETRSTTEEHTSEAQEFSGTGTARMIYIPSLMIEPREQVQKGSTLKEW